MNEFKETVTTREEDGVDTSGPQVTQQTREVETRASGKTTAVNIVWYILGFIGVLLALRFVLKLLGANLDSGFVSFIYSLSGVFTAPFDNIFGVASTTTGEVQSVFEPSILVAGVVYMLIGWGIVKLLNLNSPSEV